MHLEALLRTHAHRAGLLTQEELASFFQYCSGKCGHSLATQQALDQQRQQFMAALAAEQPVNLEQFVTLYRCAAAVRDQPCWHLLQPAAGCCRLLCACGLSGRSMSCYQHL